MTGAIIDRSSDRSRSDWCINMSHMVERSCSDGVATGVLTGVAVTAAAAGALTGAAVIGAATGASLGLK